MHRTITDPIHDAIFACTAVLTLHAEPERTAASEGQPTGRWYIWITGPDGYAHDTLRVFEEGADIIIIDGDAVPKGAEYREWARAYVLGAASA